MMFTLKNNPAGIKFLAEKFEGTFLRIAQEYWAWFPQPGIMFQLVEVETTTTSRTERWLINGEQFTVDRREEFDEIYQEVDW